MGKRRVFFKSQTKCRFCRDKVKNIDYKDTSSLQKLVTGQGKMFSRKRSGNCAHHQRSQHEEEQRRRALHR